MCRPMELYDKNMKYVLSSPKTFFLIKLLNHLGIQYLMSESVYAWKKTKPMNFANTGRNAQVPNQLTI